MYAQCGAAKLSSSKICIEAQIHFCTDFLVNRIDLLCSARFVRLVGQVTAMKT